MLRKGSHPLKSLKSTPRNLAMVLALALTKAEWYWKVLKGAERYCNLHFIESVENGQNQLFPMFVSAIKFFILLHTTSLEYRPTDKLIHQTARGFHTDYTIAHQTVYSIGHWYKLHGRPDIFFQTIARSNE